MEHLKLIDALTRHDDIIVLTPQVVARFYDDFNRLGQRPSDAPAPPYYRPERWMGSSTNAVNPKGMPDGGITVCPKLEKAAFKDLLADPEIGPRLLGEKRYQAHQGTFRVLIKLLDAAFPIPFHVHATDAFVSANPQVYGGQQFGKDEAYHFLQTTKGFCPYTHIGLHAGVDIKQVIEAMNKSTDHVLELSPGRAQNFGEGFFTPAGVLHRPGSALTLEIQQPSDVYALFQNEVGGKPLTGAMQHGGFNSLLEAGEAVVDMAHNLTPNLIDQMHLIPELVDGYEQAGATVQWVFPPRMTQKFSGQRLTIDTQLTFTANDPYLLYVWDGEGEINGQKLAGQAGPPTDADEYFIGQQAATRGVEIKNTGERSLVAFALFATEI